MTPNQLRNQVVQTAIKQAKQPVREAKPCRSCEWCRWDGSYYRCHADPPQVRFPYENMSAWPVVPSSGGGCARHEEAT